MLRRWNLRFSSRSPTRMHSTVSLKRTLMLQAARTPYMVEPPHRPAICTLCIRSILSNANMTGEFVHQVIINIPSSGLSHDLLLTGIVTHPEKHFHIRGNDCCCARTGKGQTVLPYVGCGAPCNSGFHRYVWCEKFPV